MEKLFTVKDKYSSLTHFIGFILSIIGMPVLLLEACYFNNSFISVISYAIFMLSMIFLYGASTSYHTFNIGKHNIVLKRIDHCSIFVLIAGSYTPICLTVLKDSIGIQLLIIIWSIALAGILFKLFWVTCPKWISSLMYIAMGWAVAFVLPQLLPNLPPHSFPWLLAGGIFYTIGGILYSVKIDILKLKTNGQFGNHEIFHIFVMLGSLCHYLMILFIFTRLY